MTNKFFDKYIDDLCEYIIDVKRIKNLLEIYIIPKINKETKIIELLNIFINKFKSEKCDDDSETLRRKIISHSNRVYKNMKIIVSNLEVNHHIYLSHEEMFILSISCMLHDIGKTYSDKNHNFYSTVITEYLLTMDERFDSELINKILEVIYFHGKKNKNKDRISLLAKILRDADLFDEECGDSLFYLLISKIKNKKDTLNKLDIVKAKQLLKIKICNEHIEEIESKINTPGGKELYRRLLNETIENFYMFIDYIEGYEEVEDYYNLKYIDCLKINID